MDLDGNTFGFQDDMNCQLDFEINGECQPMINTTGGDTVSCKPLIGFGDGERYFVFTYFVLGDQIENIWVYPTFDPEDGSVFAGSLANGSLTNLLRKYNGSESERDSQFFDAICGCNGEDEANGFQQYSTAVPTPWPIRMNIYSNYSGFCLDIAEHGHQIEDHCWESDIASNTDVSMTILNALSSGNEDLQGFSIESIVISRQCTDILTESPTTPAPTTNPLTTGTPTESSTTSAPTTASSPSIAPTSDSTYNITNTSESDSEISGPEVTANVPTLETEIEMLRIETFLGVIFLNNSDD